MQKIKYTKVGFDAERLRYKHTGLYHFCTQLGKNLVSEADNISFFSSDFAFYLPKNQVGTFGNSVNYVIQNAIHKFWMPFSAKYRIWHCTYQGSNYFPYSAKTKIVLTVHDLNFLYEKENVKKQKKYLKKLQAKVTKADIVVTISEFVKKEIEANLEIDNKKIVVIYNGCNIDSITVATKPTNVPIKPFIFSIGTITAKKNFHVLPALLLNNDLELVIAGICQSSQYLNKILAIAAQYGVAHRVRIIGTVTEAEKYWLLENCTAFAFPSLAEGFGLPVIEAMHFGKPVFLSDKTSLPEIGGNCAYYFTSFEVEDMCQVFANGLKDFAENVNKPQTVKNRAALFNWQTTAQQYLSVYQSILY